MARRTGQSPRGWQAALAAKRPKQPATSAHLPAEPSINTHLLPEQPVARSSALQDSGLVQLVPLLALVAVSFGAGMLIGYQLAVGEQVGKTAATHSASGRAARSEEAVEQDSVEGMEDRSVMEELRSSGIAAAAALQAEAAVHSSTSLHERSCAMAPPGLDEPSVLGDTLTTEQQGGDQSGCSSPGDVGPNQGLPKAVHAPTPATVTADSRQEDLPEDGLHLEADTQSRECTQAPSDLPSSSQGAAKDSTAMSAACGAEPGTSLDEQMQSSLAPGLEHAHAVVAGGVAGRGSSSVQLEHWDEVTKCWADVTRQLKINPDMLSAGERVQLAGVLLQAWTAFQAQRHHEHSTRLQMEANMHRAAQATATQEASAVKRARFQHDMHDKQLARFQSALGDDLVFGMVVMLVSTAACSFYSGAVPLLFGHCRAVSSVSAFSLFRPWVALEYAAILGCWAGAVGDALMAAAVMVWVGRQMAAAGTLVGAHRAPLRKIALSLGAGCGLAGYFVIRRIGGDAARWFAAWEFWVSLHLVVAWCMPSVLRSLTPADGRAMAAVQHQRSPEWLYLPVYHVMMAFVVPACVGYVPFSSKADLRSRLREIRWLLSSFGGLRV